MKSDILSPSQVEKIEKLMILGQATQKDGVRLVKSHRVLRLQRDSALEHLTNVRAKLEAMETCAHNLHGVAEETMDVLVSGAREIELKDWDDGN